MATTPQISSIPFVGPSYQLVRKKADTQRLINMITDAVESGSGKSAVYLKSIPGLKHFSDPIPQTFIWQSLLYPFLVQESMTYASPKIQDGLQFILNPDALNFNVSINSGTLVISIAYKSYTNERDVNPDSLNYVSPSIVSGTLIQTINYVFYTNERDVQTDGMHYPSPPIQNGSLVVTIEYINYANQRDQLPDTINYGMPSIQSGTLS